MELCLGLGDWGSTHDCLETADVGFGWDIAEVDVFIAGFLHLWSLYYSIGLILLTLQGGQLFYFSEAGLWVNELFWSARGSQCFLVKPSYDYSQFLKKVGMNEALTA